MHPAYGGPPRERLPRRRADGAERGAVRVGEAAAQEGLRAVGRALRGGGGGECGKKVSSFGREEPGWLYTTTTYKLVSTRIFHLLLSTHTKNVEGLKLLLNYRALVEMHSCELMKY